MIEVELQFHSNRRSKKPLRLTGGGEEEDVKQRRLLARDQKPFPRKTWGYGCLLHVYEVFIQNQQTRSHPWRQELVLACVNFALPCLNRREDFSL